MILVTGGTGYVGTAVCDELSKRRLPFKVLSKNTNNKKQIKFDLVSGNKKDLARLIRDFEKIIHCAWYVNQTDYRESEENYKWILATAKIAECLAGTNFKHFLGIGTCLEYSNSLSKKSINSKLSPSCNYSLSKISAFLILKEILENGKIPFSWCRLFHLTGGKEPVTKLVPTIKRCLINRTSFHFKSANNIIDMSNIFDVARELVDISLDSRTGVFNICSGNGKSVKDIVLSYCQNDSDIKLFKFSNTVKKSNLVGEKNV